MARVQRLPMVVAFGDSLQGLFRFLRQVQSTSADLRRPRVEPPIALDLMLRRNYLTTNQQLSSVCIGLYAPVFMGGLASYAVAYANTCKPPLGTNLGTVGCLIIKCGDITATH
jgi:hypothetical protein